MYFFCCYFEYCDLCVVFQAKAKDPYSADVTAVLLNSHIHKKWHIHKFGTNVREKSSVFPHRLGLFSILILYVKKKTTTLLLSGWMDGLSVMYIYIQCIPCLTFYLIILKYNYIDMGKITTIV